MVNISEKAQRWMWALGVFLAVTALSAGTYWNVLNTPGQVLAFNDGNIEGALSPIYHFPDAMLRVWDNQFFFGNGGKQYGISVVALGESLGAVFYRRWGQALILGLCGLAFFWSLRQFRMGRPVAAAVAVLLAGTSACHNFTMTGLTVRPVVMAFAALALGFVERGRVTGRWLPYIIGGGCLGLGITEVPDVGVFYALTTAVVFWWTHLILKWEMGNGKGAGQPPDTPASSLRPSVFGLLGKFTLYVLCSGLLAWQTINTMFSTQIQGVTQGSTESPEERYAWATQWSVPPVEMWNTVAGDYFGRSMRSEESPYWGRTGRDVHWEQTHQGFRNFTMTGWHLGVMPSILLLTLVALAWRRDRDAEKEAWLPSKGWLWLVVLVCAVSMALMWGRYFPLYRLFWSLPYLGTFRNPEKWNGPFTLYAGLGVAFVLEALWRSLMRPGAGQSVPNLKVWNALLWSAIGLALLALLIGLGTVVSRDEFVAARLAEGYAGQAELMWDNAVAASFRVAVLAGIMAAGVWWLRYRLMGGRAVRPMWALGAVVVLIIGDQFYDNRGYAMGHSYQQYLTANPLTDFLDAHRTEGRLKLMPPRQPLLNNLRLTLLQLHGYDLFDPVSVSRMPTDYAELFQALEKQPMRLWEVGALRYCLTLPGGVEQLNQMDGNRSRFVERLAVGVGVVNESYVPLANPDPQQQMLRLVEFTGALPKYRFAGSVRALPPTAEGDRQALARLESIEFDPAQQTLIHAGLTASDLAAHGSGRIRVLEEQPAQVKLDVETMAPGWLVRSAKFDPDWQATLDGRPAPLLRADFLFQAMQVPVGKHQLELRYRPTLQATWIALAARIGLLLLLGCWSFMAEEKCKAA